MMATRTHADESGSLPFAMIGIILVAGLCAALFSITIATQRSVRSDRHFHRALTGADAGVQQALTYISELPSAATTTLANTGALDDVSFEWEARRNGNQWEVTSTGTAGDQTRRIEATIEREGAFLVGAFADLAFTMRGANGVDSYSSATGATDTGVGSIGSNGEITMNGNAFADQILLYGDATCTGNGCSTGEIIGQDTRFNIEAIERDIVARMEDACAEEGFRSYVASEGRPLQAGETYCFDSMYVDVDVELVAGPDGSDPSLSNPVTIFLNGNFLQGKHVSLNCAGCEDDPEAATPDAGSLQIYGRGERFEVGNQSELAAAVSMPSAACQGYGSNDNGNGGSNAQALIYGAMVCDDLDNQGGWEFHYDENLEHVETGFWDVAVWREETAEGTSF